MKAETQTDGNATRRPEGAGTPGPAIPMCCQAWVAETSHVLRHRRRRAPRASRGSPENSE